MKMLYLLILLSLSFSAFSGIIKDNTFFSKVGEVSTFQWAPAFYESDFKYDVFYYIPPQLANTKNARSLVFLHGGGQSTITREGSITVINKYMGNLKKLADSLGFVLVVPSASSLNWGGHMRGMLQELTFLMNKDLNIDPNRIGLSGHSMGGMGITRTYMWVSDIFAFIMPMAAGMDVTMQSEENLNKVFNVPYVHLQGVNDSFQIFVQRCQTQLDNTKKLETLYSQTSQLLMMFFVGDHQYDVALMHANLLRLFEQKPRNLYQKSLYGSFFIVDAKYEHNGNKLAEKSNSRYFWVEALEFDKSSAERVDFRASVQGQSVHLNLLGTTKSIKSFRIYLHSSMINLKKKIKFYLNGELVLKRKRNDETPSPMDPKDPGFIFNDYVDIKLQ